jgi:hypothetical protein
VNDRTTEGHAAEPEEVEAVLHNLCGYHLAERDPAARYEVLTREQVLYDALVAAIRRERGRALAELVASGQKLNRIAELTKLGSRQRVQRLIAVARLADDALAEARTAAAEVRAAATAELFGRDVFADEYADEPELPVADIPLPRLSMERVPFVPPTDEELGDFAFLRDATKVLPVLDEYDEPFADDEPVPAADTPWWRRR